jgi:hypothetical protein
MLAMPVTLDNSRKKIESREVSTLNADSKLKIRYTKVVILRLNLSHFR